MAEKKKWLTMEEAAERVRFDSDDRPNKYGMTKKMYILAHDFADANRSIEEADFPLSEDDLLYYEERRLTADLYREMNNGRNPNWVYYTVDIDP